MFIKFLLKCVFLITFIIYIFFLSSHSILARSIFSPSYKIDNLKGEYIIISGGCANRSLEQWRKKKDQHDKWWGNYIRTARIKIQIIKESNPHPVNIGWLVYKPAYEKRSINENKPLISYIESVRDKYNVNLTWIYNGADIINYINRNRYRNNKIIGLEYFGHSNKYAFMLDYSSDIIGVSRAWLHEVDIKHIRSRSFAKKSYLKSWGCHSGESFVKFWKKKHKIPMWGAIGKTDYSHSYKQLPFLSSENGKWVK